MFVDAGIVQAGIFISFEFKDCVIHQRAIELQGEMPLIFEIECVNTSNEKFLLVQKMRAQGEDRFLGVNLKKIN